MAMKFISSRDNPTVKQLTALAKSAPARRSGGMCLLEGEHLAQSYVQGGRRLSQLVLREPSASTEVRESRHAALIAAAEECICLAPSVFDALSSLSTPSGVLAIARVPEPMRPVTTGFVLALDQVQDPGNVGTLIRTAAAAGVTQVWLSRGCAFAWSVKTLRASQGAHFLIDVIDELDLAAILPQFNGERIATLPRALPGMAATLRQVTLDDARARCFGENAVLVLSNEGAGLSSALYSTITAGLSIPMANGVESLNVAIAGALALYSIL